MDLRPICVDVPLDILTSDGWKSAGLVDRGPERGDDIASDRAVRRMVQDGLFTRINRKYFHLNYYWKDLDGLKTDVEGPWKEDLILSKQNWNLAWRLFKNGSGPERIRIPIRMKITKYRRG
jgi:hypothetical protein